ncbi:HAD family hydrolase [Flexithrix dorotheae]|uniref:HAD family hydrolase n=1 Tax=Flexithrix dorotheae TaxID=70993 RepID=UPI0003693312|nr:HAD family phosphatase [Flexithrix dorotheae]
MLKAVLYDMDGTLVDSEIFHKDCWNVLLMPMGYQITEEEFLEEYAGIIGPITARNIVQKYNLKVDPDQFLAEKEKIALSHIGKLPIRLMPFVNESIQYFKDKNLKLAVVTGSPSITAIPFLESVGIHGHFETIITRSDVSNSKPHPDSYQLAMERLGLSPQDCIAIEDTQNGVNSASAAGVTCLSVRDVPFGNHDLSKAKKAFKNLEELVSWVDGNFF